MLRISSVPGVYMIKNLVNQKFYVGSSKNIRRRIQEHKTKLRANKHRNLKLQNAWNKYEEKNFIFEVIEFCEKDFTLEVEQRYLDLFKPYEPEIGYNLCDSAYTVRGFQHSQEFKERMQKRMLGNKNAEGRVYTEQEKQIVSKRFKGKKLTEEHKGKIRESNIGKSHVYKGESVNTAKLTEHQVLLIKEKSDNGVKIRSLMKEFGVSKSTIDSIRAKKTWRHILLS